MPSEEPAKAPVQILTRPQRKFNGLSIDTEEKENAPQPKISQADQISPSLMHVNAAVVPVETPSFQSKKPQRMVFDELKIKELKDQVEKPKVQVKQELEALKGLSSDEP
jgi:hypothetical protein